MNKKIYCIDCKWYTVHDYGGMMGTSCDYPTNVKKWREGAEGRYRIKHFKECKRLNKNNNCEWYEGK